MFPCLWGGTRIEWKLRNLGGSQRDLQGDPEHVSGVLVLHPDAIPPKTRRHLSFDPRIRQIRLPAKRFPDSRNQADGSYSMADAVMSAMARFTLLRTQRRQASIAKDSRRTSELERIVVEDGFARNAPHIRHLKSLDMHCILGAKPDDHEHLFEEVSKAQAEGRVTTLRWTDEVKKGAMCDSFCPEQVEHGICW